MFDYKKIVKSRRLRLAILKFFSFIPDKLMVKVQYRIKTGHKLNLQNPKRFTEKLQYYKLFYRDPLMKQCVDKYDVRQYIESIGLASILNECYGVFESADDVNFDKLPNQFVLKDTLGSGGNSVIICKDKSTANLDDYKSIMHKWTQSFTKKSASREWVYEGRKHRIIVEKFINSDPEKGGLVDYKLFCFNGKFKYMYVIADRRVGEKAGIGIYDENFNRLDVLRCDEEPLKRTIDKPNNFEELVKTAELISAKFPEVRIDLYNQNEKILFGEITFFDGSGYMTFTPDDFDFMLGEDFQLKQFIRS